MNKILIILFFALSSISCNEEAENASLMDSNVKYVKNGNAIEITKFSSKSAQNLALLPVGGQAITPILNLLLNSSSCLQINCRSDNAVKITNSAPKSSQNPSFSPDGSQIVFTRFLGGYNVVPSEIVKMDADGSNEVILVPSNNAGNVSVPFGSWVNSKICFASDRAGFADEIWTVNDDGSNLMQITTHSEEDEVYYIEPVFNPQNTNQIVFEYVTGQDDSTAIHQIAYVDVSTGVVTLLTDDEFDARLPSWSNDGSKILFQRIEYGNDEGWDAYIANIHTSNSNNVFIDEPQIINYGDTEYTDCSWSYNDEYILCSSPYDDIDVPNIWMFPLDDMKSPIRKTFSDENEDGAPSQSHDGGSVAFESHFGDSEEEPSEIWIINN